MEMLDKSSKPDADDLKLLDSSFGSNTPSREGTPLVSSPQQEADNDQSCEQVEGESNKWTCSPCSCDWKNFVLTACLWWSYVLINGGHSMIGPFFPNEAKAKGASPGMIGVITGSSPFSVFVLSPVFGYLLPWMGNKLTFISGLIIIFLSFLLLAFVTMLPSGWPFLLSATFLRMAEGVGSALASTSALALIPVLHPKRINTIMGFFEAGGGLGVVVGPTLGGVLYQYGGFKTPFIVVSALALVPIIPSAFLIKTSDHSVQPLSFKMLGKLMTTFVFIVLAIAGALSMASITFFVPTLQGFLTKEFNLNAIQVSLVFLACPLVYMVFAPFIGFLSDRLVPRPFIITGFFVLGVGYLFVGPATFISQPKIWLTCVAFSVIGVGAALSITPIYADILYTGKRRLEDLDGALTGVAAGIVNSTTSLGEFAGPLIGGLFTQFLSFQNSALLLCEVLLAKGCLLLGVTLVDMAVERRRSGKQSSTQSDLTSNNGLLH